MSKKQYSKLVELANKNSIGDIGFDEKIAKEIDDLNNDKIASTYTPIKWMLLEKMVFEKESIPLLLAIIKCSYTPENIFYDIKNKMDKSMWYMLGFGENIPNDIIDELMTNKDFQESVYTIPGFYSKKTLKYLCVNADLKTLDEMCYAPFVYYEDNEVLDKLNKMLDNENDMFFKDEVPEKLASIIANSGLPDEIRNKAFDIAYDPDNLKMPTPYMVSKLYATCSDALFECNESDDSVERKATVTASNKIRTLMLNEFLPVSYQMDFMNRYTDKTTAPVYEALSTILQKTQSTNIIEEAMSNSSIRSSFISSISSNKFMFTDKSIRLLLEKSGPGLIKDIFVASLQKHIMSSELIDKFLNLNDKFVNIGIIMSKQILEKDKAKAKKHEVPSVRKDLEFLYSAQKLMSYSHNLGETLRFYILDKVLNKHKYQPVSEEVVSVFKNKIYQENINKWCYIDKLEYTHIKKFTDILEEEHPRCINIINDVRNKLEETYRISQLMDKYPDLFVKYRCEVEFKESHTIYDTPFKYIDTDKLCDLTNEQLKEFGEDLIWCKSKDTFEAVISRIEQLKVMNEWESDELFRKIYKLSDLYDVLTKGLSEIEKDNKFTIKSEIDR